MLSLRTISMSVLNIFDAVCQFVMPISSRPYNNNGMHSNTKLNTDSIQNATLSVENISLLALHSYANNHFSIGYKFQGYKFSGHGIGKGISRLTTLLLCSLLIAVIRMIVLSPSLFSLSALSFVLILGFFFGTNARKVRKTGVGI